MSAETYDLLVNLLGSALAGSVLFVMGVGLGYLLWGGLRRKAMLARTLGERKPLKGRNEAQ
jgi:hypothetical protein